MDLADTLRAAAQALGDCPGLAHAAALAGLLHNRADDMDRNITIWQRTGQDVPVLVETYYGVYLDVARAVLLDPRYVADCTVPSSRTSWDAQTDYV